MPKLLISPMERLRSYSTVSANGCWEWQRCRDRDGYGHVKVGGKDMLAHRAAYEQFVGPIPAGLTLDHLCRNTRCINPAHLEPVTNRENILRGEGITARAARVTHCPKGHEYAGANLYEHRGARCCRACNRDSQRRCHLAKVAARTAGVTQ